MALCWCLLHSGGEHHWNMHPVWAQHPEGVLWYSMIKLAVLFHTADELQVTTCGVVKAMMLCDEAIRARTSPPSAIHVRAYMAMVNGEPSVIQLPPSDQEEEPPLSPNNPHLGGRTPQHLQANLGDLMEKELWQLMEELCREITLWELNAPQKPTTATLGKSHGKWGSWCRWPGGHLSERGRVCSPRPTILTCPCTSRWRVGAQRTTYMPPAPFQPDKDVGHLINIPAMGLQLGSLWINTFQEQCYAR